MIVRLINRTLFTAFILGNIALAGFAFYGYFWRNAFLNGSRRGPLWLMTTYESSWGNLLLIAFVAAAVLWLLSWIGGVIENFIGIDIIRLWWLARLALVLSAISAVPACQSTHEVLQTVTFNDQPYHLLSANEGGGTIYGVLSCEDRINFSCRMVDKDGYAWHGAFLPPVPTATPADQFTTEVGDTVIMLQVDVPTPTPQVELYETTYDFDGNQETHLNLRVGQTLIGVVVDEPEPTPAPTPEG